MRIERGSLLGVLSAFVAGSVITMSGQTPAAPAAATHAGRAVGAVRHDRSPALRDIPGSLEEEPEGESAAHEPKHVPRRPPKRAAFQDPVAQTALLVPLAPAPTVNFDGVTNRNGVLPPDTNGDVGPNHYVQWVNLSYAVYSKTGQTLVAPTNGNTVFKGFGGPCETRNDGDPIVLYDERANRWLLSQFALPNYPSGPFYQCIAISTTGDPSGAYYRYQFLTSNTKMNDYPKFGVWRDGYYMSVNQFTSTFAGAGVAVFERDRMLTGSSARMIYIDTNNTSLGGMLPADVDGDSDATSGTPEYFVQFDDVPAQLEVWQFATNWTNGTASFTRVSNLAVADFDSNLCNYARNCIPQAGTTRKLDALSDRLMYRLQYRNFGDHESFVTNHSVDVGGDHAGIRWYELRRAGGDFSVYQQGTFAPDALHRWMASAAMDSAGNIALAYNTSDSTHYPSVRYTARLAGDPLNQMTQGEADIIVGTGAQTSTYSRWGDYSMLAVDPTDDCTFWATLEYIQSTGSAPWRTRIAAFKLPGCGGGTVAPPDGNPSNLNATAVSASQVNLTWTDGSSNESGFQIERCTGAACSNFSQIAQVSANVTSYSNTGLTASTSYSYRVRAYNAGGDSAYSNTASATTGGSASAPAAPSALTATAGKKSATLNWTDNSSDETQFQVERCQGVGCSDFSQVATTAANTTSYKNTRLTSGQTYQFRVRACNAAGCSSYSNSAPVTPN